MKKTVIELFAGVGGFRVGLNNIHRFDETGKAIEEGNWDFVWANQWEPSTKMQPAYDCYRLRFGEECVNVNIQEVNKNDIPNHSLLVGGFPCQDYSVARGLSGEKGIHGKKGVLFWEIADILDKKNSPFVLLENVDRLLKSPSNQRGRDFGIMLRTFEDKGYNMEWRVINAAEYGARQKRRRIFIFAWKKNTEYNKNITKHDALKIVLEKGLFAKVFPVKIAEDRISRKVNISRSQYIDSVEITEKFKFIFENTGCMIDGNIYTCKMNPIAEKSKSLGSILTRNVDESFYLDEKKDKQFEYLKAAKQIKRKKPNGNDYLYSEGKCAYPDYLDKPGRTMLTSEGTTNRSTHVVEDLDTHRKRFITPVEAERLQHFPDNWTNTGMSLRSRYFMMGNALVTFIVNRLESELSFIISSEK